MPTTKSLTETAIDFLRAGMSPVEDAFVGKNDQLGEISVIFTWKKQDYRVTVQRFSEEENQALPKAKKTRKRLADAGKQ